MKIRSETPDDCKSIRSVIVSAFEQDQEAKLVDELRVAGDLAVSLVGEVNGRVCGYVALSSLKSPENALALAPVAVSPDKQGQGFGSAMIHEALRQAKQLGAHLVFVVGEPSYYKPFGFSPETAQPYPCQYEGPYFMAIELGDGCLTDRAQLIYPSAFDNLE